MLARLMLGEHEAELRVMRDWWQRWYAEEITPLSDEEYQQMHGMPNPTRLDKLDHLRGAAFEQQFLPVMIEHHEGAIEMVNQLWQQGGDPRILLFADGVRHSQRSQIVRMQALLQNMHP